MGRMGLEYRFMICSYQDPLVLRGLECRRQTTSGLDACKTEQVRTTLVCIGLTRIERKATWSNSTAIRIDVINEFGEDVG